MANPYAMDLNLLKASLRGSNLKKLLRRKKVSFWRLSKDCGISYRTLMHWQEKDGPIPSDDLARKVAKYLGLVKPNEAEILEIKQQQAELQKRIDRLLKEK